VYVDLDDLPTPPKEYVIDLPKLDGGLNLWDLDYRMDKNQSPDMQNLYWLDGSLGCRPGQSWVTVEQDLGVGYTCYKDLFWGKAFFHIGQCLYCLDVEEAEQASDGSELALTRLLEGVPENRGTFFRYGDALYYKNGGGYFQITYEEDGSFSAGSVMAYVPITYVNMDPTTHAGDEYQPENRLCASQTVWYSTVKDVKEYVLPVSDLDGVDKVVVDDVVQTAGTDYTVDLTAGVVKFASAPSVHSPYVANTVRITFTKANPDAYHSVMDCPYAAVYGGDQNVCVVVGGCPAQPNAYFWCGNHVAMDPGYFPFEQYNLAGDTEESITGFGKQQSMLVIFKEHSVGRASFGTQEMDSGRVLLTMNYTRINDRIGCDLPWSIQLVENNLVFCNTESGVYLLKDSTSAYENNLVSISRNVNGTGLKSGLLDRVRTGDVTASFNDGTRYWVCADGAAYVWDYELSAYTDPSWFYFTNIQAAAFFRWNEDAFHLNAAGRVTALRHTFLDYGGGIPKVYQFAAQTLGDYDRLKDVLSVIFAVRSDTNSVIRVTYLTDYEQREDLTPIRAYSWTMAPRDLTHRYLAVRSLDTVARRRPGTRHVRHFAMRLVNSDPATDMSVISAQIYYRYQGRDR
jgi:hypothetical protein